MQIALYKGPTGSSIRHFISHWAIRIWTWSKYSHAELVIDGICYSSSVRDGGVRAKRINLDSGKWDVFDVPATQEDMEYALAWFAENRGSAYDWLGIKRFVVPFVRHDPDKWFCFEAVGDMLGLAGTHKLTANDLMWWAVKRG